MWLNRNYEKARPLLEELIKLEPESAGLNYQLGDTSLHLETAQQAIHYLETAVKNAPEDMTAHASLGRAYVRVDRFEDAIPHLKAALSLDESSLYYQLAQAYQKAGQATLAQQTMQKFEEISRTLREKRPKLLEDDLITPPLDP